MIRNTQKRRKAARALPEYVKRGSGVHASSPHSALHRLRRLFLLDAGIHIVLPTPTHTTHINITHRLMPGRKKKMKRQSSSSPTTATTSNETGGRKENRGKGEAHTQTHRHNSILLIGNFFLGAFRRFLFSGLTLGLKIRRRLEPASHNSRLWTRRTAKNPSVLSITLFFK